MSDNPGLPVEFKCGSTLESHRTMYRLTEDNCLYTNCLYRFELILVLPLRLISGLAGTSWIGALSVRRPASSCGGLGPYRGENSEPGRYGMERLTFNPRVGERPGS